MTTVTGFVRSHGIRMTAEWAVRNPFLGDDDNRGMDHWEVKISRRDGRKRLTLTTFHSMGYRYRYDWRGPAVGEVLDALTSDARAGEDAADFADFRRAFAPDTDRVRALRTYRACLRTARNLRAFLGDAGFDELLGCDGE